jgi:hypothetical protein
MTISVWIEEKDDYVEVKISTYEIAEILAKHYKIPAETMYDILTDFDIDLDYEIENNDEIREYAKEKYLRS